MNMSLDRLLEAMMATLRTDVIPHVGDPYARGQAIGVVDLLNNIGARIEWARAPIAEAVEEKRRLLREAGVALPAARDEPVAGTTADLLAQRDQLDMLICEKLESLSARDDAHARQALACLCQHAHDELTRQMQFVRKPLFAEIASGGGADRSSGR